MTDVIKELKKKLDELWEDYVPLKELVEHQQKMVNKTADDQVETDLVINELKDYTSDLIVTIQSISEIMLELKNKVDLMCSKMGIIFEKEGKINDDAIGFL